MAVMISGSQGRRAAYSVREQIVPWVEQSSLSKTDRTNIVERLTELSVAMEREELTTRQLSRLVLRMTDSPVLQWGVVEKLNQKAQASNMTEAEKEEFRGACDRWLRTASEGRLNIQDMEFAVQNVATKDQRYEQITLWPDQLEVKQVDGAGKEELTRYNPHQVKLVVDRDYNERTTGLHLRTRERDVILGAFLNQDEKSSFAKAFGTALKRARI